MSSTSVTVDGVKYSAELDGARVTVAAGGVRAGVGRWTGKRIEDCPAHLPDEAYEALDSGLRALGQQGVRPTDYAIWTRTELSDGATETLAVVKVAEPGGAPYLAVQVTAGEPSTRGGDVVLDGDLVGLYDLDGEPLRTLDGTEWELVPRAELSDEDREAVAGGWETGLTEVRAWSVEGQVAA
jgi:hypothetical protein